MAPPCETVHITCGHGYWVRTYEDDVPIDANVEVQTQPFTVSVRKGWNQIGNPFEIPVCLREIQVVKDGETVSLTEANERGWVSKYFFSYDAGIGGYQMINPPNGSLEPWKGYWCRAYTDCELLIPPAPCPPAPPSSALSRNSLVGMELPPVPPQLQLVMEALMGGELQVKNYPNPVRDVHTTTFAVKGAMAAFVDAVKVEIYDLSGRLVYASGEMPGTSLDWHTDNDYGEHLANGVYLYKLYALVEGNWVVSDVRKLAILR